MKFKKGETSDIFYKIDGENKICFSKNDKPKTAGFGYNIEMKAWVDDGNEIEPQYTTKELVQKEVDDLQNALDSQNQTLIGLIRDNEYHLISRRWIKDRPAWEIALDKWAEQFKANILTKIFEKPF